jgi:DNA repair exonuclease SbcCD nuclease subunit
MGGGLNSRAYAGLDILSQITHIAQTEHLSTVLFCGDMFEAKGHLSVPLVAEARKRIKALTNFSDITAVPGNHDTVVRESGAVTALDLFSDLITVLDKGRAEVLQDVFVVGYGSEDEVTWNFDGEFTIPPNRGILMLHKTFKNTPISSTGYIAEEGLSLRDIEDFMLKHRFKMCFCGDIHIRSQLKENIWYVGSPIQQEFGEPEGKGMLILDTQTWEVTEHPLKAPLFLRFDFPKDTRDMDNFMKCFDNYNYFSVATRTLDEYTEAKEIFKKNPHVRIEPPLKKVTKLRSNLTVDMDTDTVLKKYVNLKAEEEDRNRLLDLGKQFLTKVQKGFH